MASPPAISDVASGKVPSRSDLKRAFGILPQEGLLGDVGGLLGDVGDYGDLLENADASSASDSFEYRDEVLKL